MRRIAIVGAGQAGLPLALALIDKGYEVTLATSRTPDEVRGGKVMSSQCMFDSSLEIERRFGLDMWNKECPAVEGIGLAVPHPEVPGGCLIDWSARLTDFAQAVDQRVKMPDWMEIFERRGGKLLIQDVGVIELEALAESHELVVLAAGKGEIVRLFERDAARSPYAAPQRALALTYVHGLEPVADYSRVSFNLIPGVGEYFVFPALTTSGACDIMVFEGVPGGPMDCWKGVSSPGEHLAQSRKILETFLPWEARRARDVALTDDNGILAGTVTPTVRKPVLQLPSGRLVLGLGDAVLVNDPITGQGSNNAAKAFQAYFDAIVERGDQAFTREWMNQTFEAAWREAEPVVTWTNALLQPPPPHILRLLYVAGQCAPLASAIANGFNRPADFFPWWMDPAECDRFIERKQAEAAESW